MHSADNLDTCDETYGVLKVTMPTFMQMYTPPYRHSVRTRPSQPASSALACSRSSSSMRLPSKVCGDAHRPQEQVSSTDDGVRS